MLPSKSPFGIRGAFKGKSQGIVSFTTRARPLPDGVTTFLRRNFTIAKILQRSVTIAPAALSDGIETFSLLPSSTASSSDGDDSAYVEVQQDELVQQPTVSNVDEFWVSLEKLLDEAGSDWTGSVMRVWAFGPNKVGPNILFWPKNWKGQS
jgi:ribosome assembly protein 1